MNKHTTGGITLASLLLFLACLLLLLDSAPARACGEAAFNSARGLPYQGYLRQRSATVLIYANPDPTETDANRQALYAGLTKAGHKLTVVTDADGLTNALRERHYDVVISAFDRVDVVTAATAGAGAVAAGPSLLPVVARSDRNSPQVRSRFEVYLVSGAGLGQYLKKIGKSLPAGTP